MNIFISFSSWANKSTHIRLIWIFVFWKAYISVNTEYMRLSNWVSELIIYHHAVSCEFIKKIHELFFVYMVSVSVFVEPFPIIIFSNFFKEIKKVVCNHMLRGRLLFSSYVLLKYLKINCTNLRKILTFFLQISFKICELMTSQQLLFINFWYYVSRKSVLLPKYKW